MTVPPMNRTPYDVWERILFEVIAVTDPPVFDVTCTPSTYLAFKRTCGGGGFVVFDDEYRSSERCRRSLGPWVEEPGIKMVGSIVLFGRYLSARDHKWNKGRVVGLLQQCKRNGTKLLGPVGRSWLDEQS
jgi:hypothetical protein